MACQGTALTTVFCSRLATFPRRPGPNHASRKKSSQCSARANFHSVAHQLLPPVGVKQLWKNAFVWYAADGEEEQPMYFSNNGLYREKVHMSRGVSEVNGHEAEVTEARCRSGSPPKDGL
jgi:hypothetical protein